MRKRLFQIGMFMALAGLLAAFAPQTARAADSGDEFLIGLLPEENIFTAIKKYRVLGEYLGKKLGVKVKFTILSRYGDITERFVSRDMDAAFFGIYTSLLAIEKLGVEPLVRPQDLDGGSMARGLIIARSDSGMTGFEDMRDKVAAFADPATATGYLVALGYLKDNGIDEMEGFFYDYFFTGNHASTVFAVLDGRADVGAVKDRIFRKLIKDDPIIKDEIRILARSEPLPDNTLCIKQNAPPELKRKLREVFMNMDRDPEGVEVLEVLGIRKYVKAEAKDFEPVRSLARKTGATVRDN